MNAVTTILILSGSLACALPLKPADPSACVPDVADYTFLWWANGWLNGTPRKPAMLHIQTGRYALALDVERASVTRFGRITTSASYPEAAARRPDVFATLPEAKLELLVTLGDATYRCARAAVNQKDWMNFPVRIVESGRWLQRCDILQLEFENAQGKKLPAEGRLEVIAWPDRLSFLLEVIPSAHLGEGVMGISLVTAGKDRRSHTMRGPSQVLVAGKPATASLVMPLEPNPDDPGGELKIEALDRAAPGQPLRVDFVPDRGWHRVVLPAKSWSVAGEPDRLERYRLRLQNPSRHVQPIRLLFDAEDGTPGITGVSAMLRDTNECPTGIPVQISKNWHRQKDRRLLYEGPWFHGFTVLRLPPRSSVELEFTMAWARWGGVPAVSHAQLCLIGWGWNQLWDEVAIGSWGESICYEPDAIQQRCRIDDIRPLMVRSMSPAQPKWTWTHNVGGGDFLVYHDGYGKYQPLVGLKTAYVSHGPNLTDVTYTGATADGCIAATLRVSTPRGDDLNRAYHRLRYDVLKPTTVSRLAFYQLGSDNYHWHQFNRMARGDVAGLVEEWSPDRGGKKYLRSGILCSGEAPWFSLHAAIPRDGNRPIEGAWANRGVIIRSWRARLDGRVSPPFAAVYGTEAGKIPSANLELSLPPGMTRLRLGDFVEAEVELVILPMAADDYYGPNENLCASLRKDANTWRPVLRQAAGNRLRIEMQRGRLVEAYPPRIAVGSGQRAGLEVEGGIGFIPFTFTGLKHPVGHTLWVDRDGQRERLDQSVHGNDYWQTDFDARRREWSLTYNVPLDSPGDARRTVRLWLEPQ